MLSFGKLSPFQRFVTGCQTADNKSLRFNFFKSHSRLETNVGLSNKVNTPARCRRPRWQPESSLKPTGGAGLSLSHAHQLFLSMMFKLYS